MSETNNQDHLAPLPESLRLQLEKFRKHLWRIKITEAILAGFLGLIVSFALVFALDRIWELSPLLRLLILIAGVSLFAVFAPLWINRWVFKHRRENQLAKLISNHYPNLGDRLLGVVELQDQDENKKALSPELREAAMLAVASDAKSRDLDKALSSTWMRKLALGVSGVTLVAGAAFLVYPNAGKNALKRWFMPLSDTERYTFTKADLSDIPQPLYVPLDEPFSISIPLKDDTEQKPEFAEARYETKNGYTKWDQFSLDRNQYDLNFKGKRTKGFVTLKLGDANHKLEVRPIKRPKISKIKAAIQYPEYLQRADIEQSVTAGQIEVLQGSKLSITAQADRALSKATVGPLVIEPYFDLMDPEEMEIQGIDPNNIPDPTYRDLTHTVKADSIQPETLLIPENTLRIPITWADKHGIAGLKESEITINSLKDTVPSTYLQDMKKQIYMLHTEVLDLGIVAEDDYGIKGAGLDWVGSFNTPSANAPAIGNQQFIAGDPYATTANDTISMDFSARNIVPQKLVMRSWVEDYNPATEKVYSEPIEIYLLSESEHADYQKERVKEVQSDLEEAMRTEQELLDENKRILKDLKDPAKAKDAKKKLEKQQDKELDNKEEVKKLADKMKDIFKESMKNKNIDPKTLKEMSETAQKMDDMAKKDMPEIAKKLEDAQSKKNSQEKSEEDMKEAIEKQEKLVQDMKDAAKKAEDTNKKLESSTFVNRLKQAASDEENIAAKALSNLTSGDFYADLDPAVQRLAQALYLQQKQTGADIRWIQEDLQHFYTRTQKEIHKKIIDEMAKSKVDEGMSLLEELLGDVKGFTSTNQADKWAKKLREWAKELDGAKDDEKKDGGDGEGGEQNTEDQDFEFMLRIMKMIQKEQAIRARTRALEQSQRDATKQLNLAPAQPES